MAGVGIHQSLRSSLAFPRQCGDHYTRDTPCSVRKLSAESRAGTSASCPCAPEPGQPVAIVADQCQCACAIRTCASPTPRHRALTSRRRKRHKDHRAKIQNSYTSKVNSCHKNVRLIFRMGLKSRYLGNGSKIASQTPQSPSHRPLVVNGRLASA